MTSQTHKPDQNPDANYFFARKGEDDRPQKNASRDGTDRGRGGGELLSWGMALLFAGFAAPLLLIFLIKSPQPDEHLIIFGISYHKLLHIFFLTSAVMIYASLFLLRARPLIVLMVFVLALFCCLPFIIGLRKDLTLGQVITGIPFFADWPFFLNPAYMLIEFLFPLGVVIFLFLQIRNYFIRKTGGYAFLCIALYLSVASILGLFGLSDAGQPNIGLALERAKGYFTGNDRGAQSGGGTFRQPIWSERDQPLPANQVKFAIDPPVQETAAPPKDLNDVNEMTGVSTKIEQLAGKVDGLEAQLREIRDLVGGKNGAAQGSDNGVGASKNPSEATPEMTQVRGEIRLLSEEVRTISNALREMAQLLPPGAEKVDKNAKAEEKPAATGEKESSLAPEREGVEGRVGSRE